MTQKEITIERTGPIKIYNWSGDLAGSKLKARIEKGRLATLDEFVLEFKRNQDFFDQTKNRCFWLGDDKPRLKHDRHYKIDYDVGELIPVREGEWNNLPVEKRAIVYGGRHHLVLEVYENSWGRRIGVFGDRDNEYVANWVAVVPVKATANSEIASMIRKL